MEMVVRVVRVVVGAERALSIQPKALREQMVQVAEVVVLAMLLVFLVVLAWLSSGTRSSPGICCACLRFHYKSCYRKYVAYG